MSIVIIVLVLIILFIVLMYNQLIREKNGVNNAFSTVDVTLKKRYDLIPNLVDTVKAYAKHEKEIYENISELRSKALNSNKNDEVVRLDKDISNGINELLLLAENYPDLKASENFLKLQNTLEKLENELSAARRTYNAAVTEYNISLESFPTNLFAKLFNMKKAEIFVIEPQARENQKLDFKKDNNLKS